MLVGSLLVTVCAAELSFEGGDVIKYTALQHVIIQYAARQDDLREAMCSTINPT